MTCITQQITLADGRTLAYDECGDPHGQPILFFHGTPGSRLDWGLFGNGRVLAQVKARLIAIDRPGMGFSTFQEQRHFLDWPVDVAELANTLELKRFSVLGYSSGGAYALACARQLPDRLVQAGVVSGDGPYNLPDLTQGIDSLALFYLSLSRRTPGLFRQIQTLVKWMAHAAPGLFMRIFLSQLPPVDREIATQAHIQRTLLATSREALRFGGRGAQWDTATMLSPWDFDPQEIQFPVQLWYGEEDHSTSPRMGHYLAEVIPNSRAHFFPGEGHYSLLANHLQEVLAGLVC